VRGVLLYRLVTEEWPKAKRILGSSGTIRAIHKMAKKASGLNYIDRPTLSALIKQMIPMTREELATIPGMEARRVDMILSGAILLQECMNAVHATRVELTEYSLRDGILSEHIENIRKLPKSSERNFVHSIFKKAEVLGADPKELRQAIRIAEELFRRLRTIHRLPSHWKDYLCAAALLQDRGKCISPKVFEHHSAYLARNLDLPELVDWERRLLAELCFEQRQAKVWKKDLPFKKNKKLQRDFLRLLALLRLVVAFSLQRDKPLVIDDIKIKGRLVRIQVSKRYGPELQILRAEQSKALFEEVFRREVLIEGIS
jgi:exopolyphosphatase/guanosine-5'-triphosphate,3'-diphosphate pyrophosphatase